MHIHIQIINKIINMVNVIKMVATARLDQAYGTGIEQIGADRAAAKQVVEQIAELAGLVELVEPV